MKKYVLVTILLFISITKTVTAQTLQQVKDINPAGNAYPWQLTVSDKKIFFIANNNVNGYKL